MSRKFLTPIDLDRNTLLNARLHPTGTTPSPADVGQAWYDSTNKVLRIYDGATWQPAGSAANGAGAPTSTPSSVGSLYWDSTNDTLYVADGTSSSADWKPAQAYGTTPANLAASAAAGTSLKVAREDHAHRHANADHGSINISALAAPTADVSWGSSYKITNLADPTSAQDAATKAYVDAVKTGLDVKDSVRAATTTAGTLATSFANGQVIDGVTLATGNRILVKDQATGSENGIYTVNATGAPTRATDADASAEVTAGLFVFVTEGTANADSGWVLTTNDPITVGSTALAFAQFSGAGQITAGSGMTKTGNTLDVIGTSGRIVANADSIDLATVSQSNSSGTAGVNFVQSHTVDSYGRITGTVSADVRDATTTVKGIASFSSTDFSVASGAVSLGTVGVGKGGTGLTAAPTNGQLAIGNGTGYTLGTIGNGTGISVTNGSGTISIANTGVTGLTGTTNQVSVSGSTGSVTLSLPQSIHTAATPQFAGLGIGGTSPATGITVASGKTTLPASVTGAAPLNVVTGTAPSAPVSGDIWISSDLVQYRTSGGATKTVAFTDSTITGNAGNVTGTVAVANGGTGATTLTSSGVLLGNGTSAVSATAAGSADQVLRVPGAGGSPAFGAIDVSKSAAVTGSLAVANGGTGSSTAAGARTNLGATTKYTADNGALTPSSGTVTWTITHSLGTQDVVVQLRDKSTNAVVDVDMVLTDANTVTLQWTAAATVSASAYRVVIVG